MSAADAFGPPPERRDPPLQAGEREMLDAWLDYHRATLLWKCEGLTSGQLKQRSVEPSAMSLLGLVRHMADVERGWFRRVLVGDDAPPMYWGPDQPDGEFHLVDGADVEGDFATYAREVETCRKVAARHTDLGAVGARQAHGREVSLRWIYVHMIEEYARHNGHADLLRERIDGRTGD